MPILSPFTPMRQRVHQTRFAWPVFAMLVAFWLVLCAVAFALMIGWLQT